MRTWLPALAVLAAAGCGYEGEPLPPLANIPSAVTDLSAIQRGDHIVATFIVPTLTTEGRMLRQPPALDLRVGPGNTPFDFNAWLTAATMEPEAPVENGVATYQIPTSPWVGKEVMVGVRVTGENGKSSAWSNVVTVPVVNPLQTPSEIHAESTAQGVQLSWKGAGQDFRVFRRIGNQPFTAVADVPMPPWTDTTTVFGMTYTYHVQTIEKLTSNHEAESDFSMNVSVTPVDVFPPAVPAGLQATVAGTAVELSWQGDTDGDLAGYRVYRASPGSEFHQIGETSGLPSYSDRTVMPGQTYRYAVTAFDRSGNESAHSAPADAAVP
jgi:hypothetical protein